MGDERPPIDAAHSGPVGAFVGWACRAVLAGGFALLVSFALRTNAQPPCGPLPKPDRWPLLLPALGISALFVIGGWWLIGRIARLDSTAAWLVALFGVTACVLFAQLVAVLFLSFATLC